MIHLLEAEPLGSWREPGGEAEVSGLYTGSLRKARRTVGVRWEAAQPDDTCFYEGVCLRRTGC